MDYLFSFIHQKMLEHGVKKYHVDQPVLIEVAINSTETIDNNSDFIFTSRFYTGAGTLNGKIVSDFSALNIDHKIANAGIYKHHMMKGKVTIYNLSTTSGDTLYVELLRVTPIEIEKP